MADINFPTDTSELAIIANDDLIPIYDVSSPGDLKEAQAINVAKTLIDDTSTTATDRTWSVNKSKTYVDGRDATASTLTNKTINADNNTITNLELDNLKTGVLDTDLTSVSAADDTIPSAKATKAMGDLKIPLTYIDTDGTLAANSDVKLASQKASKTYVDTEVASAIGIKAVTGSDYTTTSISLSDVTGLSATLEANQTYQYRGFLKMQSSATTTGYALSAKYSGTKSFHGFNVGTTTNTNSYGILSILTATTDDTENLTTSVSVADTTYLCYVEGVITTTGTGNLTIRTRSEVNGSTIRVMTGSTLHVIKIG